MSGGILVILALNMKAVKRPHTLQLTDVTPLKARFSL